jgi:amino acid adenylation domain-containing protein
VLAPVHESFVAVAARYGGHVALLGDETIRYAELASRVTAIATRLRSAHVAIGDRVAIWAAKSTSYATCILAALRAGAAYVPLDGGQPAPRARAILRDAEPAILVTDRAHLELLGPDGLPSTVREVIVVDGDARAARGGASIAPLAEWAAPVVAPSAMPAVGLEDLAAILYTSGSTGTPKGVKISHRNLANFVAWAREEMQLGPTDVFSNHASFNFDLSTYDLFGGLASGAAVWIVPDADARNVAALAEGMRRHRVTVWYSVPSILTLLVGSGALDARTVATLRYVHFAGEVFPIARLRELRAVLPPSAALYNLYGPTETNVCTYYRVGAIAPERATPVPIGAAIRGATLHVIDADGNDVTGRGEGELVVAGACVTPGYWRREDERNAENHRRGLHATGDLVSYEGDQLVYRGRKDRMVKISGYRVELGEIEAAVLRHPAVREAAVVAVAREDATRIVAFCATRPEADVSLLELKAHCSRLLPRYMVPHALTRAPSLPKNANGKTDYVALARLAGDAR